jgi:two-component sensor histidine kinase/sensor domain CHASE-containing protein
MARNDKVTWFLIRLLFLSGGEWVTLRFKSLVLLCAFTAAFMVSIGLYLVARNSQLSDLEELDKLNASRNVGRLLSVLENYNNDIRVLVEDWAVWDDSYNFMDNRNAEFIDSNIDDTSFLPPLNIESIIFVRPSGEIFFDVSYDLNEEEFTTTPEDLLNSFKPGSPLMDPLTLEEGLLGPIQLSDRIVFVSAYPVLTSEGEGPPKGLLVMTRRFTPALIERVGDIVQIDSSVISLETAELDPALSSLLPILRSSSEPLVQVVSRETIEGFALIQDIYGEPILLLKATMPREIFLAGTSNSTNTLFYVLIVILFIGAITTLLMERNLLTRIGSVTREMEKVAESGSLDHRVPVEGEDEISGMADLMNLMLEKIQRGHEELETTLKQKDLLVREVHHRVKNNLQALQSLIDYRMATVKDNQTRKMLIEEKGSIRAMGLIHQQLYESENLMTINFSEYLSALSERLSRSYSTSGGPEIKVRTEKSSINLDTALPVGLIVNELLSNSLKHAFPLNGDGLIEVSLVMEDDIFVLTIKDDGKGLPESFSTEKSTGFGLTLVNSLVEQLGGSIDYSTAPGTTITIRFTEYSECRDTSID